MDTEIPQLIVALYKEINMLKSLLETPFYTDFKTFLESGNRLYSMMNTTLESHSLKDLSPFIEHTHEIIAFVQKDNLPIIQSKPELLTCLNSILSNLYSIQSKKANKAL